MGERLLPRTLPELFAHSLAIELDATKRFSELERYMRDAGMEHVADEFEQIGKEEREQYELLAVGTAGGRLPELSGWEYAWHYLGTDVDQMRAPRNPRDALTMAIRSERRAQNFYADVAEHSEDDAISAFAAEMAADESRHIARLEMLLMREPDPALLADDEMIGGAAVTPRS
jgi:rubrerythrin